MKLVARRSEVVSTALVVLLGALAVFALWPRGASPDRDAGADAGPAASAVGQRPAPADDDAGLAPLRVTAALPPCPSPTGAPPAGPLATVTVPCLGAPGPVDLGRALAGRATLLNVWASWCAPCRQELPALAEYAARPGAVPVLGIVVRDDPRAALALLAELDVRLAVVTDPDDALRLALDIPPGLPMSYLVRADGSVVRVDPPIPFGSADDVAAAVARLSVNPPSVDSPPGNPPSGNQLRPDRAPGWLRPLVSAARDIDAVTLSHHRIPPPADGRRAAVLVLFGEDPGHGPDVLLMERASTLRDHPGQVAFPGGGADPTDTGPVHTALREAEEETGLLPSGVQPLALLPNLFIPPSGFVVTPVLAHWAHPMTVHAVDPQETAAVVRVPVATLADPAHRLRVRHPAGYVGPAFVVAGLLVWGFTGGILSALLDLGGWARPWDTNRTLGLGEAWASARAGRREVAG